MNVPTLHLTVGLPGSGKTHLARRIESESEGLRLTPDEWIVPIVGPEFTDAQRDILEGRLLWVAHRTVRRGVDVIVDFGCWGADERWAIRDLAERDGARFVLHHLDAPSSVRRERTRERHLVDPFTIEMTDAHHDEYEPMFQVPTPEELEDGPIPAPPDGMASWSQWASTRWPSLPRTDR